MIYTVSHTSRCGAGEAQLVACPLFHVVLLLNMLFKEAGVYE